MRKTKLQLALSSILLVTMVLLFVATTVAYFSDHKQFTNTITSGNVEIVLSEAAVTRDSVGHLVEDKSRPRITSYDNATHNYGRIYPSQTIFKDPTIKNTGSEEAWVAYRITLKDGKGDLRKLLGYHLNNNPNTISNEIDISILFDGALFGDPRVHLGEWNGIDNVLYTEEYAMVQVADPANNKFEFYVFILKPLQSGEDVTFFNTMTIPNEWNNAQMQELAELTIEIEAFGVQTFNMVDCYTAMTTALPEYFNFNKSL